MPEATPALSALTRGLIDYAGLFPPAARTMTDAVNRCAGARCGPHRAALGRFIVPAARLIEWEQAVAALPADVRADGTWHLSALLAPPPARDIAAVADFNERESTGHDIRARVDAVEIRADTPEMVEALAAEMPTGLDVFIECPLDDSLENMLAAIARAGAFAKVRTAGLVPTAVPPPEAIAAFLLACMARGLAFKVAAGLHHPLRGLRPLTCQPDAPRAMTHGFLNVFAGVVLAMRHHLPAPRLQAILEETHPEAFVFTNSGLSWRNHYATVDDILTARQSARSFGSCSFDEPIAGLKAMSLLV
jgi:hypothetical protein